MPEVVELIDRAVDLPPGPQLATLLAQLPWDQIPNARLVEILQARARQLAHDQAHLFAGMAEIARATPVAGLPDGAVSRAGEDFEWASHEIAAALTWTPTTADRELDFALTLRALPLVFAAPEQGLIDRGKAKVFCDHLDPARGLDGSFHGLTEAQILARLLAQPRPEDSEDTPDFDDADSSDTDSPGAGSTQVDSSDGRSTDGDRTEIDSVGASAVGETGPIEARAGGESTRGEPPAAVGIGGGSADGESAGQGPTEQSPADRGGASPTGAGPTGARLAPASSVGDGRAGPMPAVARPADTGEDRWRGEQIALRDGVELRVGLATLLGCDQRPAEIPGLGPVDAEIARTVAARQRRGARWQFAIVDTHGYLLLAGPLRRRPRPSHPSGAGPPDRVRGGVVELHLTLAELRRFAADPDLAGDWAGLIAEIADRWADRHRLWRKLSKDPRARFARGPLADHIRIRDRTCVGPCCDRSARRSQLDHTVDHGRGGDTVEGNIGPGCWRHHADKDKLRHEAQCRIPYRVGRDLEEDPWV
jgi:hypothetical protein